MVSKVSEKDKEREVLTGDDGVAPEVSMVQERTFADADSTGVEGVRASRFDGGVPDNPQSGRDVVERGVVEVASGRGGTAPRPVRRSAVASPSGVSAGDGSGASGGGDRPQRKSYKELYEEFNRFKPLTDDEIKRLRRKQQRESIFAAIGDGISAMSNLYFTTQYAPDAYDGKRTLSDGVRERYERYKKEYDDNLREHHRMLMQMEQMDRAEDDAERDREHNRRLDALRMELKFNADKRKEAEEAYKEKIRGLNLETAEGRAKKAKADAEYAAVKAEYADDKIAAEIAAIGRRGTGGRSGGRDYGMWSAVDENGVVHDFPASNRDQAYSYAGSRGWRITGPVRVSTSSKAGLGTNAARTTRTTTEMEGDSVAQPPTTPLTPDVEQSGGRAGREAADAARQAARAGSTAAKAGTTPPQTGATPQGANAGNNGGRSDTWSFKRDGKAKNKGWSVNDLK